MSTTIILVCAIIAVMVIVYFYTNSQPAVAAVVPLQPPALTAADLAAYMKNITTVSQGTNVVKTLTSGTGDRAIIMQLFPQTELTGWNSEGKSPDPTQPNNADGSVNWIYMEDYTFFADQTTDSGFIVTDSDGAKQVPFARQSIGGEKKYYFKSFKVTPGTLMMITSWMPGSLPGTGFMLQGRDCRNVEKMLVDYPELTGGNNGIFWEGWPQWEIHWSITTLNKDFFHQQMLTKFNTCLDTALSIGNDVGNMNDPQMKLGLHYADGTQITGNIPGQPQMGRWIYDYKCNPIIDPQTNKQAYSTGGGGWGQSCNDAYKFCKLDPGTLVGVKLSQFAIDDNGIPKWVGVEDIAGGISNPASALQPNQIGWMPSTTHPPPADATAQLNTPKTAPVGTSTSAPTGSMKAAFSTAPSGWLNRMSTGSADQSTSHPSHFSAENSSHHSGHSYFHSSPVSMRYASQFS